MNQDWGGEYIRTYWYREYLVCTVRYLEGRTPMHVWWILASLMTLEVVEENKIDDRHRETHKPTD